MVKREVFGKLSEAFPMIHYKPDHVGQENFDGARYIHAYFDTVIDTKDSITGGGSDRYLSEDYMFCQMWRKIGGQIWLCPWMKTHHIGTYAFTGDLPASSLGARSGRRFRAADPWARRRVAAAECVVRDARLGPRSSP